MLTFLTQIIYYQYSTYTYLLNCFSAFATYAKQYPLRLREIKKQIITVNKQLPSFPPHPTIASYNQPLSDLSEGVSFRVATLRDQKCKNKKIQQLELHKLLWLNLYHT